MGERYSPICNKKGTKCLKSRYLTAIRLLANEYANVVYIKSKIPTGKNRKLTDNLTWKKSIKHQELIMR